MPQNKQALVRYRIIDRCLRDKRNEYPSREDLQDALEEQLSMSISESTIEKDIRAMREDPELGYNAPIKYSRKYNGYYYTDDSFTIANIPLSQEDLDSIEFAAMTLRQFDNIEVFGDFKGAVDKIFDTININSALDEEDISSKVQFEQQATDQGAVHLSLVLEAIREHYPIKFSYQRFGQSDPKEHIIHPYLLKQYNGRWYLIGQQDSKGYITTFALDRISEPESLTKEKMKFHASFDPDSYFRHSFGITTFEGEAEKVVLSFDIAQAQYIKTQPLHPTQTELRSTDKEYVVELEVGHTIELEMAILSYGERVEVLEPKSLRASISKRLKEAAAKYK